MDSSCLGSTSVSLISKHNDDSQHMCAFHGKKTNRRLSQPMAMERKVQHVDGRDAALDLIPLSKDVFHQEVYPEP